ncbi:hypothetical protein [Alkalinema sp. FACHB-956]|uniref:hypothetical protein n=1 Tax=Alkalinema sp. FACHB-956 TaxID=2692768 RepID=UPI001687BC80|nr:hypothetical protein [Alkalinema sp. FACHB-956]MBD2327181.1 hypothetical protein [Alkalinema sp. FACHB-956]
MADIPIQELTTQIGQALTQLAATKITKKYWVDYYGANDIHPANLVFWICVQTDAEKQKLINDREFMQQLRSILDDYNYPIAGRNQVVIGFESQETVNRESAGNWWHHWR